MKHRVIVDYNETAHEITIAAPTPELHEMARSLPGIRERKKSGTWVSAATFGMVMRMLELYGDQLEGTVDFQVYVAERINGMKKAHMHRAFGKNSNLPEIPITSQQPFGVWMHQRLAFWFAYNLEAAMLNITMGGGKTKIATDLMQNWKARDTLIISPLAAIEDAWYPHLTEELVAWPSTGLFRHQFNKMKDFTDACEEMMSIDQFKNDKHRIIVVNHESFWREPFRTWAAGRDWDLIIDDEIHREKSAGSLQSGFLFMLSSRARRRLGLTGTLMPHSPLDVYGQYRFLDRGIFGTNVDRFNKRYATFGGFEDRQIIGYKNLNELKQKIATITITVDDSEQGLPEVAPDIQHKFDLEPVVRRAYDDLDREFLAKVKGGEVSAANVGVKLIRLHQLACGIARIGEGEDVSTKRIGKSRLLALADVLEDFDREEPIVIFTRFKYDLNDIQTLLARMKRSSSLMGSGINELQKWKKGKTNVLVAQIQAVKEGVDCTRSAVGIFYSTGINLGDYLQCRKRLHRPPQDRMVRFIHILARATRDISTFKALKDRRDVVAGVIRDIKRLERGGV